MTISITLPLHRSRHGLHGHILLLLLSAGCLILANLVQLVAKVRLHFDKFGALHPLAVFAVLEVLMVLVFEVKVECGVAEVLLGTETLVPWYVFVEFGLAASEALAFMQIVFLLGLLFH